MSPVCVPGRELLVGAAVAAGAVGAGVFGLATGHVGMGIVGGIGELVTSGILVAVWPTDRRPVEAAETEPADPIGAEPYPVEHITEGPVYRRADGPPVDVPKPRRHLRVVA